MNRLTTHKGFVLNGDFGTWSGGLPTNFDIDQTSTTVLQLNRAEQGLHLAGQLQPLVAETLDFAPNVPLRANPLVRSGSSALRFRAVAAAVAGDFALRTSGIGAAHTSAPTGQRLPIEGTMTSRFSWWSRGTPGNLFAVNLILQRGSANPRYFQAAAPDHQPQIGDDAWTATVDALTYPATPEWHQYQIEFQPIVFSTNIMDDQLMFEFTNVTAGAFILDLDSIEYTLDDPVNSQGSV